MLWNTMAYSMQKWTYTKMTGPQPHPNQWPNMMKTRLQNSCQHAQYNGPEPKAQKHNFAHALKGLNMEYNGIYSSSEMAYNMTHHANNSHNAC